MAYLQINSIDVQKFNFKLKCKNEDFQVNEISLIPKLVEGKKSSYSYIYLEKQGLSTFEAIEKLKEYFQLRYDGIGAEGLKDEQAITKQIISLKTTVSSESISKFNQFNFKSSSTYLRITDLIGFGEDPVQERNLHGNCFRITIRNLNTTEAKNLFNFCSKDKFIHFVNYYDNQRFGVPSGPFNTYKIGENIIKRNWVGAFREYLLSGNKDQIQEGLVINESTCENFFRKLNPKKIEFFVSSYNSFLWNKHASKDLEKLNSGQYLEFENIGALFLPDSMNFKTLAISSITAFKINPIIFSLRKITKNRRIAVTTSIFPEFPEYDDLFENKKKIALNFFLPSGSYATMLVKQLFIYYIKTPQ